MPPGGVGDLLPWIPGEGGPGSAAGRMRGGWVSSEGGCGVRAWKLARACSLLQRSLLLVCLYFSLFFIFYFIFFLVFLSFLGPILQQMEDPRLGVESEL